eukprot:TRINITY_DN6198_c1_g1_i1.p1 TRINITY_DN6198_c1_g1~~TRINITY_DN6198_c1_g1_i1.p1  ORF type:complete len:468 (-),score=53.40 TRINITY_DN6198_c1_g1_i1:95-1498(-)
MEEETPLIKKEEEDVSLPWKQVIPLVLLQICESFNNSSIFAYVPFLVLDFSQDSSRDTAGTWAGFVSSVVYMGAFCSSYAWGKISDRYGKRPCLLAGTLGTFICCVLFGFSSSLPWAITTRFMAGLLNGNLGVAKAYLGLITNSRNQARAFGLISVAWGCGAMLGSSIGGLTARPAVTWPDTFGPDNLFTKFPYLLPNLITAFVLGSGFTCAYFFLPEPTNIVTLESGDLKEEEEEEELISIWKQPQALLACGAYIQLGFIFILFEETLPLWLTSTVSSGGLDFTPPQIGLVMMQLGAWFLFVQLAFYRYIPETIGVLNTHRFGMLLMIPVVLVTPLVNRLAGDEVWLWVGLCSLGFVQALGDACSFSVMVLVSNSVGPRQFGEANGLGQTGVALVRAMGPAIGGPLFAWSLTNGMSFPFNNWLLFCVQAILLLWLVGYSFFLSPSLNAPKVVTKDIPLQTKTEKDD